MKVGALTTSSAGGEDARMSELARPRYVVDPNNPRAPSQRVWDQLSAEERARVDAELPSRLPAHLSPPPEGDEHYEATMEGREALRSHFAAEGKRVYVGAGMAVYYPDEAPFAPDVFAVVDVATHRRDTWLVGREGRGLDWVLEVLVSGDRRKDLEQNVLRYARLGVREYFVHEPRARRLRGYRLSLPGGSLYESIEASDGVLKSRVLGLELRLIEGGRLRFRCGDDELLAPRELIERLDALADDRMAAAEEYERLMLEERVRAETAEQRAAQERERAEHEHERAETAEQRAETAEQRAEQERVMREEAEAALRRAHAELDALKRAR